MLYAINEKKKKTSTKSALRCDTHTHAHTNTNTCSTAPKCKVKPKRNKNKSILIRILSSRNFDVQFLPLSLSHSVSPFSLALFVVWLSHRYSWRNFGKEYSGGPLPKRKKRERKMFYFMYALRAIVLSHSNRISCRCRLRFLLAIILWRNFGVANFRQSPFSLCHSLSLSPSPTVCASYSFVILFACQGLRFPLESCMRACFARIVVFFRFWRRQPTSQPTIHPSIQPKNKNKIKLQPSHDNPWTQRSSLSLSCSLRKPLPSKWQCFNYIMNHI